MHVGTFHKRTVHADILYECNFCPDASCVGTFYESTFNVGTFYMGTLYVGILRFWLWYREGLTLIQSMDDHLFFATLSRTGMRTEISTCQSKRQGSLMPNNLDDTCAFLCCSSALKLFPEKFV